MAHVVEVDRLVRLGAGDAFDRDVERARDRHGAAHAIHLELDGLRLGACEFADQRRDRRHRTTTLAARDRGERVALLLGSALVQDESDYPVTLNHRARRMEQDGEAQAVEPGGSVLTSVDAEDEPRVAVTLGRPRREPGRRAWTHGITAAGFAVFAADLPLNVRHVTLQPQAAHKGRLLR